MKVSTLTIGQRIIAGFSLLTVVSAVALGFGYYEMSLVHRETDTITEKVIPGLQIIGEIGMDFEKSYADTLGHILATDPAEMEALEKEMGHLATRIHDNFEAYEKTIITQDGRVLLQKALDARKEFVDVRNEVVRLSREGKKQEAGALRKQRLSPAIDTYQKTVEVLAEKKHENATHGAEKIQASVTFGQNAGALGTAISVLVSVGVAWGITRSINRTLRGVASSLSESTAQVSSAAGQVSSASQSLAEGASEQAASLEETSASLEEIASMTKQNAGNAQDAKQLANEARQGAEAGVADMEQMKGAMDDIKTASDNIARIIKTIDEIAFQTNILALNAAVEAARAGDAGMGFAVVADEVRNLAQRSAVAAKETAQKIEDCIAKSETGVAITGKVSQSLEQILAKNRRVDDLVAEIANASREQSQGIDQVNIAVTQMDKVTQNNAASSEESASAAEELNGQARELQHAVADLEALVGGRSAAPSVSSAPSVASPRPARPSEFAFHSDRSPARGKTNGSHPYKTNGHSIPLEDAFRDF